MFGWKSAAKDAAVKGGVAVAQATGDLAKKAEIALQLSQAMETTRQIAKQSPLLPGAIGRTVAEIAIVAKQIIVQVELDPEDFPVVRSFFDYNLGKALEVIKMRVSMSRLPNQEENLKLVDTTIAEVLSNFKVFLEKCQANDIRGAEIAATTLSRIIKAGI